MKTYPLTALLLAASSIVAFAAGKEASAEMKSYSKNLARQHMGTNLFVFNADNQTYVPTEAAAAWLDDDVTTGWPPQGGKQFYLLSLTEAELMTNFAISAREGSGTVSVYAGDEPAAPGAASWTSLARDVSIETINQKKLDGSFNRFAKYLLIETNLAEAGPWYSLYLYGERPASDYALQKRSTTIDTDAIFGPYVNNQTAFNFAGLYADGRVTNGASQAAIDDNPQTAVQIAPHATEPGLVVRFSESRPVQRVALLADASAKGKLDFYLIEAAPASQIPNAPASGQMDNVSIEGMVPTVSMVFDGSNPRGSIDFPAVTANTLVARWIPEDGSSSLSVRELNSFGDIEIANYAVKGGSGEALTAQGDSTETYVGDGKTYADYKDSKKTMLPPVGEFLPSKSPFLPGGLGFPPNLPPREFPRSE